MKRCTLFIAPIELCKLRNAKRSKKAVVPDYVYDRMLRYFDVPTMDLESFDVIRLAFPSNVAEYLPVDEDVLFEELDDFDQDNSHHGLTLGEHMKKTVECCKELLTEDDKNIRKIVLDAGRWHDIGKAFTKTYTNFHGEETEEAHYYGHEHYGAYLYLLKYAANYIFPDYYTAKDHAYALVTAELINLHMIPFNWEKNPKSKEKYKKMLKPYMMRALEILHKADVMASNAN